MSRSRYLRRPGHSLIELVAAMASGTVLLAGLGAVILIGDQIARVPSASNQRIEASQVLHQLDQELRYATFLVAHDEHHIELVVADRDGDQAAERIRYEWSGTPGDPLERIYNGDQQTRTVLVAPVQNFTCALAVETDTTTIATSSETPEATLASNTDASNSAYESITRQALQAVQVLPALIQAGAPAEAASWNATAIEFYSSSDADNQQQLTVELCPAGAPNYGPTGQILGSVTVAESSLSNNPTWNTVAFDPPVRGLSLHRPYAIVWRGDQNGLGSARLYHAEQENARWVWQGALAAPSGVEQLEWQPLRINGEGREMFYRLRGTYTEPADAYDVVRRRAIRSRITLQSADATHSRIDASVPLANRPELLSGYWRTDFDHDPTEVDRTGDGQPDWALDDSGFDPETLDEGLWRADAELQSYPADDLARPATLAVRCRDLFPGDGNRARVYLNADRQNGQHAAIAVHLERQPNGSQTLTLTTRSSDAAEIEQFTRDDLSTDFVTVELTVLPEHDVVHLALDGVDQGAFRYERHASGSDDRTFALAGEDGSVEFDFAELRVAAGDEDQ